MQSDQSDLKLTSATPTKEPQSVESSSAKSRPMIDLSDSDSDIDLDNDNGNNSYLAGLNLPDRLKNILRYKDISNTQDGQGENSDSDDDDDDGVLFMRPSALPKTPTTPAGSVATPTITASTTTRLAPIEPSQSTANQQSRFEQLLARAMASDSGSDNDDTAKKAKKKAPTTKKSPSTSKSKQPRKPPKKKGTTKAATTTKKKKAKSTKPADKDDQGGHDSDASSSPSDDSIGTSKKKKKSTTLALLEDSDDSDSDSDGSTSKPRKQLSRKAKLEMQRETQRLRRDAHAKIQPRVMRKTLDSFLEKLDTGENDDAASRPSVPLDVSDDDDDDDMEAKQQQNCKAKQSPSRINIYKKYKKELQELEELKNSSNNNDLDDDEEDGLIIVRTGPRGAKFMKSLLAAVSPEQTSRLQKTKGKPSSPLALRTLNQQLMARMTQEQQAHRQEMEEKAKAMGVYLSAEERATKHLEREQEAAVLDLEVQQLLYKKAMQKQQTGSSNDRNEEDGDYEEGNDGEGDGEDLVFSGEEDEDEDADDGESGGDGSDNDEEHVVLSRRAKSTMKQKNPFLDDDDDEREINKKAPKAPEPAHSIANFFNAKSNKNNTDDTATDTSDEPKKLSRLMQRTTIEEEAMDIQEQNDSDHAQEADNNDEHQDMDDTTTEQPTSPIKTIIPTPKKPKQRNDFVEEEAEEEEDEFFGLGGPDVAETADLDQFEEDGMLVQDSNNQEKVDSSELQAEYHKNMIESDQHMVERLIKDITSGGLRRKRAAAAAGLLLDDYDLYDDDDAEDLVALRLASANKRKKFMKGDNIMTFLASDPKTAAFAKAAMPNPGEFDLSGDEMEEEGDGADKAPEDNSKDNNQDDDEQGDDEQEDDQFDLGDGNDDTVADSTNDDLQHDHSDESDEDMKVNIDMVVGDFVQPWARQSATVGTSPTHG